MKTLFDTLCTIHKDYRFIETYDYYNSVTDAERLYIKSQIGFVYEYYTAQHTRIQTYEQKYTACTVLFEKRIPQALLAILPSPISIPPLIALLLPAQILSIPIIASFADTPSYYTLTTLELLGIEDIFIGSQNSFITTFKEQDEGIGISSESYYFPRCIYHYVPPVFEKEVEKKSVFSWLYPDALYDNTRKAHVSHRITTNTLHLWIYPSISLECYYSIDYTMR